MRRASLLVLTLAIAACADGATAPEAIGPSPLPDLQPLAASHAPAPPALAARDQAVIDAVNAGTPMGAVVEHNEFGCFLLVGFFVGSDLVAFGGLFPDDGCGPGTFDRTNPDGAVDTFGNGRGGFFLVTFDPSGFFGSEGSDVRWHTKSQANGSRELVVTGTLSDGSRVRAHGVTDRSGRGSAKGGMLWVESLGYVVRPGA